VAQAKNYAAKLLIRHTYATNGKGIYAIDMHTGKEGEVAAYPTPDELWSLIHEKPNEWLERFAAISYEDKGIASRSLLPRNGGGEGHGGRCRE